jgi:hypothetical protein
MIFKFIMFTHKRVFITIVKPLIHCNRVLSDISIDTYMESPSFGIFCDRN